MNLVILVASYLKSKPLNTLLNIVLLALGIAVITILLLFSNQLKEKISDNTKGIDLVVGAKGSPLQLILCNIFHIVCWCQLSCRFYSCRPAQAV